ncbi:hypothetical protein SY83_12945 [Paenibacillus swuensis]|uniref:Gcp-like domain-containing protein n=2 Tax=Paenibacillus swuensis TaxID=1178515 RepID=A0A172TPR6_9BACL|nr:hypothetical protein SY83_12945 [Paenibacillus swuensis]
MDTSTSSMSVAVLEGNRMLEEVNSFAERNHSLYLLPIIQQLLGALNMQVSDLDGIAVGRGPGSYTGVRIGVTVGKTLAWANRIPVIGVSSLEALSYGSRGMCKGERGDALSNEWIVPLMDARRGQAYTALFRCRRDGSGWERMAEDAVLLVEPWLQELKKRMTGEQLPERVVFVGELEKFTELIHAFGEAAGVEVQISDRSIRAEHIGQLAFEQWSSGMQEDTHAFVPNYTQLAEAEVNLKAAKK